RRNGHSFPTRRSSDLNLAGVRYTYGSQKEHFMDFDRYETEGFYDEMYDDGGRPRARGEQLAKRLRSLSTGELGRRQKAADLALLDRKSTRLNSSHVSI